MSSYTEGLYRLFTRISPSSILPGNGERAGLGDQVFIDSHILATLLPVSTLLDPTERRLCRRAVSGVLMRC